MIISIPDGTAARRIDWVEAQWELFWMVFHGQTRLDTFRRLRAMGVDRRTAAEMIAECEREG